MNDAFGTAHRAHASTEGVTKFLRPSVSGFLLQKVRPLRGRLRANAKQGFWRPRCTRQHRPCAIVMRHPRLHILTQHSPCTDHTPLTPVCFPSQELDYLDGAVSNPKRPFCAIVGGSKVSSKITVIEALLDKVDKLIIG